MSERYSLREKELSNFLSKFPRIKNFAKRIWYSYNFAIYRKDYGYKIFLDHTLTLIDIENENTFFGYYDKTPINPSKSDLIIFHKNRYPANKKPNPQIHVDVCLFSLKNKKYEKIDQSFSWNYQQGSRLHWISDEKIIFNIYSSKDDKYMARIVDINKRETKDLPLPIYDTFSEHYALSLNFDRLALLRPDYGYRNRIHSLKDITPYDKNDGIWYMNIKSKDFKLVISLDDLVNFFPKSTMQKAWHKVNHIMISPDGNKFIFLHRWILNKRRFDRLFLYNFEDKKLKLLLDEDMISHYSWIDNSNIIIYGRYRGEDNYYIHNIENLDIYTLFNGAFKLFGDGHPSVCNKNKNLFVIDTYPDKSRMRKLILINKTDNKYVTLGEFSEPLKYDGETRCDLHPNFSLDCSSIHFDTIFMDKRCLAILKMDRE